MDGDPEALYYLGKKYFSFDDKADSDIIYLSEVFFEFALQRYRIFAEEGNTEAMYGIYKVYDTQSSRYYNLYGYSYCRNYEENMKEEVGDWLVRAASYKYAPALYILGYKENGIVDLPTYKSLQYAKEALEAGYADADVLVGLGNLQLKQEREQAERVRLYQQSQKNANEWLKELEYDFKLDSMERWMNYKDSGEYKTNRQLYTQGKKSFEEYMSDSWLRDTVKNKGWFKDSF